MARSPAAARSPADTDAFTAIAEPRRRDLLAAVAQGDGDRDVSRLVAELGWPQPQVSKHLGVLRKVGLVTAVRKGKRRVYSVNGSALRPVYDWVKTYERFWDEQLQRIKDRAEKMAREAGSKKPPRTT
jgi:DNA-binding transcriptional ArsR family regulator